MIDFLISPWTTPHMQMTLLQSLTAFIEAVLVIIVCAVFVAGIKKR